MTTLKLNRAFLQQFLRHLYPDYQSKSLNGKRVSVASVAAFAQVATNQEKFKIDAERNYVREETKEINGKTALVKTPLTIPSACRDVAVYFGCQAADHAFVNTAEAALKEWFKQFNFAATNKSNSIKYNIGRKGNYTFIGQDTIFNFVNLDDNDMSIQTSIGTEYGVYKEGLKYRASIESSVINIEDEQWQKLVTAAKDKLLERNIVEIKDVVMFLPFILDASFQTLLLNKVIAQDNPEVSKAFISNAILLLAKNDKDQQLQALLAVLVKQKLIPQHLDFQQAFNLALQCPNSPTIINLFFTRYPTNNWQSLTRGGKRYADDAQPEQLASLYARSVLAQNLIRQHYSDKLHQVQQLAALSDKKIQRGLGKDLRVNPVDVVESQPTIVHQFSSPVGAFKPERHSAPAVVSDTPPSPTSVLNTILDDEHTIPDFRV